MSTTRPVRPRLTWFVLLLAFAAAPALAADERARDLRDMKLFRFEFDNDLLLGSDDAFTAGWSLQTHSQLLDEWTPVFAGWIGRIPTLGDDGRGGRIVRWAWGITQLIITPKDITIAAPDDLPWAGVLGGYFTWSSYDSRRLGASTGALGLHRPRARTRRTRRSWSTIRCISARTPRAGRTSSATEWHTNVLWSPPRQMTQSVASRIEQGCMARLVQCRIPVASERDGTHQWGFRDADAFTRVDRR